MLAVLLVVGAAVSANFDRPPAYAYPQSAMREGKEGFVLKKLTITPEGRVDKCEIVVSSGYEILDSAACKTMNGARLTPAKDGSGTAVYGVLKSVTSYALNARKRIPLSADVELKVNRFPPDVKAEVPLAAVNVVVDAKGNVESCDVGTSSGAAQLDALACSLGVPAASITPAINNAGVAVRSVQRIEVAFALDQPPSRIGLRTP